MFWVYVFHEIYLTGALIGFSVNFIKDQSLAWLIEFFMAFGSFCYADYCEKNAEDPDLFCHHGKMRAARVRIRGANRCCCTYMYCYDDADDYDIVTGESTWDGKGWQDASAAKGKANAGLLEEADKSEEKQ